MSAMQIFNCEQGTEEWFRARMGIPTASEFSTVMASGKAGGESKTRRTYMCKLAGEIITNQPSESFSNAHTERGHLLEPEARELYAFLKDAEIQQVGFIRNGDKGASPDSLIGSDGALEIKTKMAHLMVDQIDRGDFPSDHRAQCQGVLWVAEREWIDIVCYWPNMPAFIKRAYRDEAYIRQMAAAVKTFNEELAELVEKIRRYQPEAA